MDKQTDQLLERCRVNLRVALLIQGLDGTNVARRAGLSPNTLTTFMRGSSSISFANLARVCWAASVPISILLRPEGVTEERLRFWRNLEALPESELRYLLDEALSGEPRADR